MFSGFYASRQEKCPYCDFCLTFKCKRKSKMIIPALMEIQARHQWTVWSKSYKQGFPGGSVVKKPPANAGDTGSIPGLGRSLEEEMATHSCILAWKNHMDRGAWWATVHGFTKSWTQLSVHTRCIHTDFRYYQLFLTPLGMLHKIGCLDT